METGCLVQVAAQELNSPTPCLIAHPDPPHTHSNIPATHPPLKPPATHTTRPTPLKLTHLKPRLKGLQLNNPNPPLKTHLNPRFMRRRVRRPCGKSVSSAANASLFTERGA